MVYFVIIFSSSYQVINMSSGSGMCNSLSENANHLQMKFFRAVYKNDLDSALSFLRNKAAHVNEMNLSHKSALYLAIENQNFKMVKMLLEEGADMNIMSYCNLYCSYETPVVTSARMQDLELVRLFLERNCYLENCSQSGNYRQGKSALHWASHHGNIEMAELLVKYGASVNGAEPMPSLNTALHYAALADQVEMVEWLLKNGANVTLNGDGRSALHIAAVSGRFSIIKLVTGHRFTSTIPDFYNNGTHFLTKDSFGFTPFSLACLRGHFNIVCFMFEKFSDRCELNLEDGLQRAAESSHIKVMEFLLWNGALVNNVNETGESPLSIACHGRHSQMDQLQGVKLLLEHGAYINVVDSRGYTPLSMALLREQNDIAMLLIKHGAAVDACEKTVDSPLRIAFNTSNPLLIKYLIQAGCHLCRERWFDARAADEKIREMDFQIPGPSRFRCRGQLKLQAETWQWIKYIICQPRSLSQLARRTVRQHLMVVGKGMSVLPVIKCLPLPAAIIKFLCLDDVLSE